MIECGDPDIRASRIETCVNLRSGIILKAKKDNLRKGLSSVTLSDLCAQSSGTSVFAMPAFTLASSAYIKIDAKAQSHDANISFKDASIDSLDSLKATAQNTSIDCGKEVQRETKAPNASIDAEVSDSNLASKKHSGGDSVTSKTDSGSGDTPFLFIEDVTIEGNRHVATEDIMKVIKTKRGDRYDRDLVIQDLRAINALGYFDDRSLRVDPELIPGGILIKFRVQENELEKGLVGSSTPHAGVNVSHYVPVCSRANGSAKISGTGTSTTPVAGFAEYSIGSFNGVRGYRQFSDIGLGSNWIIIKRDKPQKVIIH
jgi:hypothetical protein